VVSIVQSLMPLVSVLTQSQLLSVGNELEMDSSERKPCLRASFICIWSFQRSRTRPIVFPPFSIRSYRITALTPRRSRKSWLTVPGRLWKNCLWNRSPVDKLRGIPKYAKCGFRWIHPRAASVVPTGRASNSRNLLGTWKDGRGLCAGSQH
jgi:hypothetical protein